MKTIVEKDNPILRQEAAAIPVKDIVSAKTRKSIEKMKKAMHAQEDGVAIAAPQVGESVRIFVVKGSIMALEEEEGKKMKDLVCINPQIIKKSQKKVAMEEGCLSIRWLYGDVLRHEKVTIKAYNEERDLLQIGASGLLAQIFQHEIDHLNGILFTDKARNLRDLPPAPVLKHQ